MAASTRTVGFHAAPAYASPSNARLPLQQQGINWRNVSNISFSTKLQQHLEPGTFDQQNSAQTNGPLVPHIVSMVWCASF